ncbi:hypothetical protein COCNU_13G000700 [Cocos nucifera]|uniref:Uncharacterized protein n=1 Tax=Cocos nucifera TaxID=13894 RepID=A0A8K0ISV1_COCNU|nr:hypothetical protein COCNU_13G000700 [Cocos nucifera]
MPSSHAQSIFYSAFVAVLSFMAEGIPTTSHCQPSPCWCCGGIHLQYYMVLDVAFFCIESIYFLYIGSDPGGSQFGNILRGLLALCSSVLAQGQAINIINRRGAASITIS